MLHPGSKRPNGSSAGRRSNSRGGLFFDAAGIIHIRVGHVESSRYKTKVYRTNLVLLACEKGAPHAVGEIRAVPTRMTDAMPTCMRCIAMETP